MRTIRDFFVTCLVLAGAASVAAQPSVLYAVNEGGELLTIDPRSMEEPVIGKATRVGPTTSAGSLVSAPALPAASPRPLRIGEEVQQVFETPHPYTRQRLLQSLVIHHPGATYIAPHFGRFELANRDFVIVRSPDGSRWWRYDLFGKGIAGRLPGGFWSGHIVGDTAIIDLYRYGTASAYGFRIDKYARGIRQEEIDPSEAKAVRVDELCGPDDSKEARCFATSDPLLYNRARAVARLLINGLYICTGWLLGSEGQLITNYHCIDNAAAALNTDVEFMAEGATCATLCASVWACPGTAVASSTAFVRASATLDYALVTPQTTIDLPATYGYLQTRPGNAVVGERIYIPQHPAGWGKRIAVTSSDPSDPTGFAQISSLSQPGCPPGVAPELGYAADTQTGSSGSPVIAFGDHLVIGLHHCGSCLNRAVPIETVIADLGLDRPNCAVATTFGCNPGINTNNAGSCAACTNSSQCAFGLSCVGGKCIASGSGPIGTKCCNDVQCASKSCGSDDLCGCNSNVDCPSGQACRNGRCREARSDCEGCLFNFQCASADCRAGRCITPASKGLGQDCCRDGQCASGSCSAGGTCQCTASGGCPPGFFCNVSVFLDNACEPFHLPCDRCSADKQCGPGLRCDGKPFGRCIKGNENRPIGADCCRDGQCASGSCPAANSKCQCANDSDCGAGNYCALGALGFLGIGKNTCKPCTTAHPCKPRIQKALAMLSYRGQVITAFEDGGIYSSPDGLNLGGGGDTVAVYPGPQRVTAMLSYQGRVITAFEDGGIYSSPDGLNLGGGGDTIAVYPGPQRVTAMLSYQWSTELFVPPLVITAFEDGGIYSSPDGLNLGGGGSTIAVYPGPQRVTAMLSYQWSSDPWVPPLVITAFEGGGIYSSPDGRNLGGGGSTSAVYPGPQRVTAMRSYQWSTDPWVPPLVITAFKGGGIYSSPDGLNLGGGGSTSAVYPGPQRVTAMLSYQGPSDPLAPPRVITAFEGGGIYSSPDGLNLGGGGTTSAVYPGPQRVTAMLSYQWSSDPKVPPRVITAFEGGGIYSSPDGLNLGGGGSTISVYPPF